MWRGLPAPLQRKDCMSLWDLKLRSELTENFLRYLQSAGDPQAQRELMQGEFWHFDDGRASEGMVALLDILRTLSQSGKRVSCSSLIATASLPSLAIDRWRPALPRRLGPGHQQSLWSCSATCMPGPTLRNGRGGTSRGGPRTPHTGCELCQRFVLVLHKSWLWRASDQRHRSRVRTLCGAIPKHKSERLQRPLICRTDPCQPTRRKGATPRCRAVELGDAGRQEPVFRIRGWCCPRLGT